MIIQDSKVFHWWVDKLKIKIEYFAFYQSLTGIESETVDIDKQTTPKELLKNIILNKRGLIITPF